MNYFRLKTAIDGSVFLTMYKNQKDLLKDLNEEHQGLKQMKDFTEKLSKFQCLNDYYYDIIIKGEQVVPEPFTVVKTFKVK